MKNSNQTVSRISISAFILAAMFALVSCSTGSQMAGTNVLLSKDGTVQSNIRESFEESYYDKEELQQTILAQAATYNRQAGSGSITVEKVDVKDGMALVQMTYAKASDYAAFNKATFFVGSPKDADSEDYNLNVVLSSVKNQKETLGKADILAVENMTLLITDISDSIVLNGKAVYVSENVVVEGDGKTVCRSEDSDGLAYIIFK